MTVARDAATAPRPGSWFIQRSLVQTERVQQAGSSTQETTRVVEERGDHDRFSHIVLKTAILESAVNGTTVVALCSKRWLPSRAPDGFPLCPTCESIAELAWGTSTLG